MKENIFTNIDDFKIVLQFKKFSFFMTPYDCNFDVDLISRLSILELNFKLSFKPTDAILS